MTEDEFWKLIGTLDWDDPDDDDAVVEPVVEALSQKSNDDIFQFEEILAQKLFDLDTKAHAKEIGDDAYTDGEAFFSADGFLYSRCLIVANGKDIFDQVLKNPKEFPKDMEFEPILYIAQEAYEDKNEKKWEYTSPTDYETFKNEDGWK